MPRRRHRHARSSTPPQTTRARLRGEFIRRAKERKRDYTVDWVHLKLNDQAQRTVLCKDPFKAHDERVEKLIASRSEPPAACPRSGRGTVTEVLSERPGLQRVTVASTSERARAGLRPHRADRRRSRSGDEVVVNTTAVELGPRHRRLARRALEPRPGDAWARPGPGHIMKLRYTSLQADTGAAEEHLADLPTDLGGVPVVVCSLHSQVAVRGRRPRRRPPRHAGSST